MELRLNKVPFAIVKEPIGLSFLCMLQKFRSVPLANFVIRAENLAKMLLFNANGNMD